MTASANMVKRCPVCRQVVRITAGGNAVRHDVFGRKCTGSGRQAVSG